MLKKRIIPCLDVKEGRTVKGVQFLGLRDAGDPVTLAGAYAEQGADELVFLDISATVEKRSTMMQWVQEVAQRIHIPFTVGGGIRSPEDARALLLAGADKIAVNSSAVRDPNLIRRLADAVGSQSVVVAMDVKRDEEGWFIVVDGGRTPTDWRVEAWVEEVEKYGAGEILLTSMDEDGSQKGFALDLTHRISELSGIPLIASGGAGTQEHFAELFLHTKATGALAASVFHYGKIYIPDLKNYLKSLQIPIR